MTEEFVNEVKRKIFQTEVKNVCEKWDYKITIKDKVIQWPASFDAEAIKYVEDFAAKRVGLYRNELG